MAKKAEASRPTSSSPATLMTILNQLHDGVVVCGLDGHIIHINQWAARLGGFDDASLPDNLSDYLNAFSVYTYPDKKKVGKNKWPIRRALKGDYVNERYYVTPKKNPPATMPVIHCEANLINDDSGRPNMAVMTFHDVTRSTTYSEQLKASEEKYQAFIRNSSEGIWAVEFIKPISTKLRPETQVKQMFERAYFSEANQTQAAMYGFKKPKELLQMPFDSIFLKDDKNNHALMTEFVTNSYRLVNAESHELDKDDNNKYFLNSIVGVVENDKLVRVWGTQRDVTAQRQAEIELRRSRERLALAFRVSRIGTWEWDMVAGKLRWSDELKALFGMRPDMTMDYQGYLSRIYEADRPMVERTIKNAIKNGKSYKMEHRVVWPNGKVHWLYCQGKVFKQNGQPVRMLGTAIDIDRRKRFEIELQESEVRFRTMADTAPVLIWVAGTDTLRTYFNKVWLDFTGRTMQQEVGNGWLEGIYPEDRAACESAYRAAFASRKPFTIEYRLRRHDGQYRWVLDNGAPRFSKTGTFLGFIGSCVDVDELKRTTRRKQELELLTAGLAEEREQLVATNTAKDEFISLASHQLRTPATGVKQFLGMVLEGYVGDLDESQREMLEYAYESNERQLQVISDLLKVAQVDAGKMILMKEKVDMVALLKSILQEQQQRFESRGQTVTFRSKRPVLMANVDPGRMRMVFENLIDNASKYTPDNKKIEISLDKPAKSKKIAIQVRDEGVGIRPDDMAKLFQKFSRLENPLSITVGGTGLGLYWARKIINLHKGSIEVESEPDKGTTFTVKIPA